MSKNKGLLTVLLCCSTTLCLANAPVYSVATQHSSASSDASMGHSSSDATVNTANLTVDQRLSRLENQVQYVSSLSAQLQSLQQQLATLRGQVESLQHSAQKNAYVAQNVDLLSQRMTSLEALVHVEQANKHNVIDDKNSHYSHQESQDFNHAYNLLMQKQYSDAINAFKAFIKANPKSQLVGDANYWLGELYLVEGQPDQASQKFRLVIDNPQNDKAPDAMLKQATIFMAYGDTAHAKEMYQRVIKNYSGTNAASVAQARLKALSAKHNGAASQ